MQEQAPQALRTEHSLEDLNARIARLALFLGIALDDAHALQAVINAPAAPHVERRCASPADCLHTGPERRREREREELRGLLVMRYQLEAQSLGDQGYAITREVWAQAHAHLMQQGFKPGADGSTLDALLTDSPIDKAS